MPRLKPRQGGRIDWSDPITKGLVFCCTFNQSVPRDLVTGTRGVPKNSPTPRHTMDGVAAHIAGTAYYDFPHHPLWNVVGDKTILWRGVVDTGSTYHHLISKGWDGTATPWSMWLNAAATPTVSYISSNTDYKWWYGNPSVPLGVWHTIAVTSKDVDTTPAVFMDGQFYAPTLSFGIGWGAPTTNTNSIRVGRRIDNAIQMDGITSLTAVWSRQLTRGELLRINRDPFCFVRSHPRRRRYGFAAAPASGTTYSVVGVVPVGVAVQAAAAVTRAMRATSASGVGTSGAASASRGLSALVPGGQSASGRVATARATAGSAASATSFAAGMSAARQALGTIASAASSSAGARASRQASGMVGLAVSVRGAAAKISGASTSGIIAFGIATTGTAAMMRGAAGNVVGGASARVSVGAARGVSGNIANGHVATTAFHVRRAIAGAVAQATGLAGQAAVRRALQGLIAQGVALLLQPRVAAPGNGKRRVTGPLDVRRISGIATRANTASKRDTRRLTSPQDD